MKKYAGFTLIEMLIVMGIIIILMSAGIAGGRFALRRANRIQKQSAVDNMEQALWGYYSDNRRFPSTTGELTPATLMGESNGYLHEYMDAGQFDGGADGSFWYFVSGDSQEFVVCASFGGWEDEMGLGIYCSGNGIDIITAPVDFGLNEAPPGNVYDENNGDLVYTALVANTSNKSNWFAETRDWTGSGL